MARNRRKRGNQERQPNAKYERYRERSLEALGLMRRTKGKLSLTRAAREVGLKNVKTVIRYVGSALKKGPTGRYSAAPSDRFLRTVPFLTPDSRIAITVRGSRQVSRIARYWAAVTRYADTGDASGLAKFEGKSLTVGKVKYPFVIDLKTLNALGYKGELSFEDFTQLQVEGLWYGSGPDQKRRASSGPGADAQVCREVLPLLRNDRSSRHPSAEIQNTFGFSSSERARE